MLDRVFEGWSGFVKCEQIEGDVYINHYDQKKGSIVSGCEIEFKLRLGKNLNGEARFEGFEWVSEVTRDQPKRTEWPVFDVTDSDQINKELIASYENSGIVILVSKKGIKIHDFENKLKECISDFSLSERKDAREKIEQQKKDKSFLFKKVPIIYLIRSRGSPRRNITDSIIHSIYSHQYNKILEKSSKNWIILGDETGDLREFRGVKATRKARMMWIAVPPGTKLAKLHPFYHGSDIEFYLNDTRIALENLISNNDVGCFIFSHEEGQKNTKIDHRKSDSEHLRMWQYTLPLVLEWVASKNKENSGVEIYLERVADLEPGQSPLRPMLQEYFDSLGSRTSWGKLRLTQHLVLGKSPNQHPWMGYSDAIGHIYNQNPHESMLEIYKKMQDRSITISYRQDSLNGPIRNLLKSSSNGYNFLMSIYNQTPLDYNDYVKPLFSCAVKESLATLNDEEWDDLLQFMDTQSRDKNGQRVSNFIHDFIDVVDLYNSINEDRIKFDLLRMLLGTSNHRGAIKQGVMCRKLADDLLQSFTPTADKVTRYENLVYGLEHNVFIFRNTGIKMEDYSISLQTGELRRLGVESMRLGLSGGTQNLESAIAIQRLLMNHGDDRRAHNRHRILYAELCLELGNLEEASDILSKSKFDKSDTYYLACLAKLNYLNGKKNGKEFDKIFAILGNEHPSERISYWSIKNELSTDNPDIELVKKYLEILVDMTSSPTFNHDVPGVIISCELFDLKGDGIDIGIDVEEFFETVKSNSQPSTLHWLDLHPPNPNDWLSPLNFNYR